MRHLTSLLPLLLFAYLAGAPACAQSSDPDNPSALEGGKIVATVTTGSLSDKKTTYYALNVDKGVLEVKLDVTPLDQRDGGGLVEWTLMDSKFQQLKYDNLAAQGSPSRQVKELPVTLKRRIIMKVTAAGNIDYAFTLSGSALK